MFASPDQIAASSKDKMKSQKIRNNKIQKAQSGNRSTLNERKTLKQLLLNVIQKQTQAEAARSHKRYGHLAKKGQMHQLPMFA